MGLRDRYAYAIQESKGKFQGSADERDGKLYFKGTVASEADKNEIWNAIKTIPDWQKDIVADIQVSAPAAAAVGTSGAAAKSYTVKAGDTLGKIAKETLGNAGAVHEDLRRQQRRVERSRQDQAGTGSSYSVALSARQGRHALLPGPRRPSNLDIGW